MGEEEELSFGAGEESPYYAATASASKRFRYQPELADSSREEQDSWMMTYIDLITLLLTLFVTLLAYVDRDNEEYTEVTTAMAQGSRGVLSGAELPIVTPRPPSPLESMGEELTQRFAEAGLSSGVEIAPHEGGIDIQLSEKVLFASGEADFSPRAVAALRPVLEVLRDGDHAITVEGHTDNVPIATERFPSNWELSSARATSVVRHLINEGIAASRLRAVGLADTQPLADNDSEVGRRRNRRVTLIITTVTPSGAE